MTQILLYKKPFGGLILFLLTIPFIAIGIYLIVKEPIGSSSNILGWIWTAFFGLIIPFGLIKTSDKREQIIINENGIWDRSTNQVTIKWEQIVSAEPMRVYKQHYVKVLVDETFKMNYNIYGHGDKVPKFKEDIFVLLKVTDLKIKEKAMAKFINEMILAQTEKRKFIIQKHFENLK